MTEAVARLRRILELERAKKCTDSVVMGGLDGYLQRFLEEMRLPDGHRLREFMGRLPPGGYRVLHPVQRRTVVKELLSALNSVPASAVPAPPPVKRDPPQKARVIGTLDSPVTVLKGISRYYAGKFARIGASTVGDLLFHFPHRYNDFASVRPIGQLVIGDEQTVIATVWEASETSVGRRKATQAFVGDDTGTLRILWWGNVYVARQLRSGMKLALSGRVTVFRGRRQMENPEWEPVTEGSLHTRRLVPVYPSTEALPQRLIRSAARQAVDAFAERVDDPLPPALRSRLGLPPAPEAIRQFHFPDDRSLADAARRRFAFEELLLIELGVVKRRLLWQAGSKAPRLSLPDDAFEGFVASLPFALTQAQRRAAGEIMADMARDVPMSRLLEGDVGSGKTVVAAAALLSAVAGGLQGAIMAPTEILAEQHYRTLSGLLEPRAEDLEPKQPWFSVLGSGFLALEPQYLDRPVRIALLTGSLKAADKAAAQDAVARGDADIVVGTHALIQEDVSFARLGLAVIDEQHRFGVVQRAALREKADMSAHVLVMTATPIPRTLALTVYGDLDISVLDEMPPGRPPVKTYRLRPEQRQKAYDFVRKQVQAGRQGYVICPLVEESEAVAVKAAVQEYDRLREHVFPDLRLGLVHGRLPAGERDTVMRAFRDGDLDVLVSTAVVEVGVDVPNATVILIEGADRFGLAQLHQFRGRVRRSERQAYCLLLSDNPSPEAQERLRIMETVHDGFRLAEEDLRLRGPGEYFGVRQSGLPDLRVASLSDVALIEEARREATRLLEEDPDLSRPENRALGRRVAELWERLTTEVS